jgi:hypothetical protein
MIERLLRRLGFTWVCVDKWVDGAVEHEIWSWRHRAS